MALDEDFSTGWAEGILTQMGLEVAKIDKLQTDFMGNFSGA